MNSGFSAGANRGFEEIRAPAHSAEAEERDRLLPPSEAAVFAATQLRDPAVEARAGAGGD